MIDKDKFETLYRGRPLDEYTREELMDAIDDIAASYEQRIKGLYETLNLYDGCRF